MVNVSIARRYARALLEVAAETAQLDTVSSQLTSLVQAMEGSAELADVMANPAYSRQQRQRVVESISALIGGVEPALASALRLLVDRNRLVYLPDIARLFRDMVDVRSGRVRGRVVSATPLAPEVLAGLGQQLERITQRNVVLETRVEPGVLGGVAAQVGPYLYDGTLRSQLDEMRRQLKGQP
jgi:F-type H+-transporting ATPase subunit delta